MILTHVGGIRRPIDPRSGMEIEHNLALTDRDLASLQFHCGGKCPAFTAAVNKCFKQDNPELLSTPPATDPADLPVLLTGPGGGYVRAWPAVSGGVNEHPDTVGFSTTDVTDNTDKRSASVSSVQSVVQPSSTLRSRLSNLTSDLIGGSADAAIAEQCAV